jgi:hypothetical protein
MPSRRPILAALAGLSPVSIITRSASACFGAPERHAPLCSALTLAALLSRTRSANVNSLRQNTTIELQITSRAANVNSLHQNARID